MTKTADKILTVTDLSVAFTTAPVVSGLSFSAFKGSTIAIVGESGSGKSVSSLAIMGLLSYIGARRMSGSIQLHNKDATFELTALSEPELQKIRGNRIAMIFQEPMTSLDPVFSIGDQIIEALTLHRGLNHQAARNEALRLLELVRIPNAKDQLDCYPHQLSGGMRQRVMIAMAASCNPDLLIADEPTTALDVTIQAQILQIIRDMQKELGTAVIFVTHDMGVVAEMADDILVMRNGEMVETGPARSVIIAPTAPYTRELMAAVPKIGAMRGREAPEKFIIPGVAPSSSETIPSTATTDHSRPLISIQGLTTHYPLRSGFWGRVRQRVHAAENISFDIYPGETLALVGESGSGKSTVGKTLQQLVAPVAGRIFFHDQEMIHADKAMKERFKREIQYVFQDPFGSLNPRKTIRQSLIEPIRHHRLLQKNRPQITELLESVNLPAEFADRYPHEFSGGQRQRICIARALACQPSLIIADEAVSALDVSVQAQIINLLMDLQQSRGLSYLFISHDMAVDRHTSSDFRKSATSVYQAVAGSGAGNGSGQSSAAPGTGRGDSQSGAGGG